MLLEWIERLQPACPPVAERLRIHCQRREAELKTIAAQVLAQFDTRQWLEWAPLLEARSRRLAGHPEVFQVLALERLLEGRRLQALALRNRSQVALHQLRIGIKKFRYLAENFLPDHYRRWGKDLKTLQDQLGEVHDLDVLGELTRQTRACTSPQEAQLWRAAMAKERTSRLQTYREKMAGRKSLWHVWSAELPAGEVLRQAILQRFAAWSESLDPDPAHTRAVAQFSLQLYDALQSFQLLPAAAPGKVAPRDLLHVAAFAHEVARRHNGRKYHKRSRRMLLSLELPPGWSSEDLALAGLVVRYHRGALPEVQKLYAALPADQRHWVDCLGGILRLAESLAGHGRCCNSIAVARRNGALEIVAAGYHPRSRQAERIAAERHLLEDACTTAVILLPAKGRGNDDKVERTIGSGDSAAVLAAALIGLVWTRPEAPQLSRARKPRTAVRKRDLVDEQPLQTARTLATLAYAREDMPWPAVLCLSPTIRSTWPSPRPCATPRCILAPLMMKPGA